jgi:hypothetical protein
MSYTAAIDDEPGNCSYDEGSDGVDMEETGVLGYVRVVTLTPTAAEMIDGAYVVTSFDARNELTETVTEGFCTFGDFASREEFFQAPPYLGYIAVLVGSAQR